MMILWKTLVVKLTIFRDPDDVIMFCPTILMQSKQLNVLLSLALANAMRQMSGFVKLGILHFKGREAFCEGACI